mgnify:CR=1 FL=1
MTKTALTRAPKAKLVDELLATAKTAEEREEQLSIAISQKVDLEIVVRNIMFHLEELLDDIELPRKFSFMWIIMNFSKISRFLRDIVVTIKDAKKNKLPKTVSPQIVSALA